MQEGSFWLNADKAAKTVSEVKVLKSWLVPYRAAESKILDLLALSVDFDPSDEEMKAFFESELADCEKQVEELEVRKMLASEMDSKNCYFSINAGAGEPNRVIGSLCFHACTKDGCQDINGK